MKPIPFTLLILFLMATAGCRLPFLRRNQSISQVATPNPVNIVIADHEFAWNQIVDELDNYFKIKREERVRIDDGILTEGIITTYPCSGSSILEPWRHDSTPGFEKWLATFQTIRRQATVRVIPAGDHFMIEVVVIKEMEDMPTPEKSTVGSTIRSNANTGIDFDGSETINKRKKWYPIGRDPSLEQKILTNILGRLKV